VGAAASSGGGGIEITFSTATPATAVGAPAAASTLVADAVICALPAPALASAVARVAELDDARAALEGIPFGSVAVVNLAYRGRRVLPRGLAGFGYLVPSGDRCWRSDARVATAAAATTTTTSSSSSSSSTGVLGMTWDSDVFPGQSAPFIELVQRGFVTQRRDAASGCLLPWSADDVPARLLETETRVTVMLGGATMPREALLGMSRPQLVEAALRAAREHLAISARPDEVAVNVAADAIPQYTLGHDGRVAAIHAGVDAAFGGRLVLLGNSYSGIGLSDSVANALDAGRALAERLAAQ